MPTTSSARRRLGGWKEPKPSGISWGRFTQILTSAELIAAYGDNEKALVMYGTSTVPVQDAPGAECATVQDGKITHMRIIFGRLPFEEARNAARPR